MQFFTILSCSSTNQTALLRTKPVRVSRNILEGNISRLVVNAHIPEQAPDAGSQKQRSDELTSCRLVFARRGSKNTRPFSRGGREGPYGTLDIFRQAKKFAGTTDPLVGSSPCSSTRISKPLPENTPASSPGLEQTRAHRRIPEQRVGCARKEGPVGGHAQVHHHASQTF